MYKLINSYFNRSALPYRCILSIDSIGIYVTGIVISYLQYGDQIFKQYLWAVIMGMFICLIPYLAAFYAFHTYRCVLRFASFLDLLRIGVAMITATFGVFLLYAIQQKTILQRHILMLNPAGAIYTFIVGTLVLWLLRIFVKSCHDNFRLNNNIHNVFIYGCMQGGVSLAKSIRNDSSSLYKVSGFITGDQAMDKSWLLGERVYYDCDDVVNVMISKDVNVLLVSPSQTERFTHRSTLIDALILAGIKIMMMPPAVEWDGKSDLSHSQLREVKIEDLLPRHKIEVDMEAIGSMLRGKRILITGAAGSIGSELARQVARFKPSDLILVDQAETPMHDVRLYMNSNHKELNCHTIVSSITDMDHMESIFCEHKPEYVFHAAAYKHVPMMEDNPGQAVRNNIFGTRVIADLAVKYGTRKFVMISTDKAVNPTNVMGCSKRICEIYCQALNNKLWAETQRTGKSTTQFITTRFGNVLGSNGSVIPIFREQIKRGGPVKVTHPDIIRYFMLIPEACRLVLEAGTMGHGGEIFVFDMGDPVRIVDLAHRMIALSGAKDVNIEFTGLRDGEKLYEELLATKESTKPTIHPKIMIANVREYPYDLALQNEIELYELSKGFDDIAIVKKMKEIVPEFISNKSKYTILD